MKEIATRIAIYGTIVAGAFTPVVPTEMQNSKWDYTLEVPAFETDDGFLSDTQYYQETENSYLVRGELGLAIQSDTLTTQTEKVNRSEVNRFVHEYTDIVTNDKKVIISDDIEEGEKLKSGELKKPKIKERLSAVDLLTDPLIAEGAYVIDRYAATNWSTAAATVTFPHTVSSADTLVVAVGNRDASSDVTQGVTYNGVSLTQEASTSTLTYHASLWYLTSPSTGTNNIVVDLGSGANTADRGLVTSVSLSGADTSDVFETTQSQYGTGTTTMSVSHSAGNIGIDMIVSADGSVVGNQNRGEGSKLQAFDSGSFTFYSHEYVNKYESSKDKSISAQETTPTGLFCKSDGLSCYVVGTVNDTAYQYDFSSAWDGSTANYASKSCAMSTQDTSPQDIFIKPDGTKLYMVGSGNDMVYQYSLSSAWDISTCSYDGVATSTPIGEASPESIWFNTTNGTVMYTIGTSLDSVHQHYLTTPWDISTAQTATTSFSLGNNPADIEFTSDGVYMLAIKPATEFVQYELTTPYDVSTSVLRKNLIPTDYSTRESNTWESQHLKDLTTTLTIGITGDTIYTYELDTATTTTIFNLNNPAGGEEYIILGGIIKQAPAVGGVNVIDGGIIWFNEDY